MNSFLIVNDNDNVNVNDYNNFNINNVIDNNNNHNVDDDDVENDDDDDDLPNWLNIDCPAQSNIYNSIIVLVFGIGTCFTQNYAPTVIK